jgi:hypothetical protein
LDTDLAATVRQITESLSCSQTLANGYDPSSGSYVPLNLAAPPTSNDCNLASSSAKYLKLLDRNGNQLTSTVSLAQGPFRFTGADGDWNLIAQCDWTNNTIVIRAARPGASNGFGADPLTKRIYDFTAANSLYLIGSPPGYPSTQKLCQNYLGGTLPGCPAGQFMTGLDNNGNAICQTTGVAPYVPYWSTTTMLGNTPMSISQVSNAYTNGTGMTVGIDNNSPSPLNPGAIFYVNTSNPAYANVVIFQGNATANLSLEGNKPYNAAAQQNAASINFMNAGTADWWHQSLRDDGSLQWHYRSAAGGNTYTDFLQTAPGPGSNPVAEWKMMPNGDFMVWTGSLWANGAYLHSDSRLKKDIESLPVGALEKIEALRGVSFRWKKDEPSAAKKYGVIAQEVEKVAPELVSQDKEGMRSVDYPGMNALFIDAIKELKQQNDALAAQVKRLQDEIEKIRSTASVAPSNTPRVWPPR